MKKKEYMTLIDGNGEKYEVLDRNKKIVVVMSERGITFNIPVNYLTSYDNWCRKNKR